MLLSLNVNQNIHSSPGAMFGTLHGVLNDTLGGTLHVKLDGILDGTLDNKVGGICISTLYEK